MKKIIAIAAVLALFSGCTATEVETETPDKQTTEESTGKPTGSAHTGVVIIPTDKKK